MDILITYILNIALILLTILFISCVLLLPKECYGNIGSSEPYEYFKHLSNEWAIYPPAIKYFITVISVLFCSYPYIFSYFLIYMYFPDIWIRPYYISLLIIMILICIIRQLISYIYTAYAVIHDYEFNKFRQELPRFNKYKELINYIYIHILTFGLCISCLTLFD